jgi:hypothetical protein
VISLVVAVLGAALTALFVARRRSGSPIDRPLGGSPIPAGTPQEQPASASVPGQPFAVDRPAAADDVPIDVTHTEPATVAPIADVEDRPRMGPPVRDDDEGGPDVALRPPVVRRRRGGRVAAGLVLLVVAAVAIGLIALSRDGDQPEAAGGDATNGSPAERPTTTAMGDGSPDEAFALAADRLVSGGSFGYAGTTSAIDVSRVRPGLWLAVDLTVEGEVVTSGALVHEIAVDGGGRATETVTQGPVVWGRLATSREALPEATYLPITEESGEGAGKGVALLPTWLGSTVDRQDVGTDGLGRRMLRATLPASVLGETVDGRPAGDAIVVLTLDGAGDPVHVEVTSVPTGPPLRLALDLFGIGEPVLIDVPAQ